MSLSTTMSVTVFISLTLMAALAAARSAQTAVSTPAAGVAAMASCKAMCRSGTCRMQSYRPFSRTVKCECHYGWDGEKCDIPRSLAALKPFQLPRIPFPGRPLEVDLTVIDKRVRDRDGQCADNFVCRNGGYCSGDSNFGYRCICPRPYTGTFCTEICEKRCVNGGQCFRAGMISNGRTTIRQVCKCPRGYQGEFCEIKL